VFLYALGTSIASFVVMFIFPFIFKTSDSEIIASKTVQELDYVLQTIKGESLMRQVLGYVMAWPCMGVASWYIVDFSRHYGYCDAIVSFVIE
jgi:hypothetical protein